MKLKLLLAALIFPFIALAQRPDTVGVANQVDSLLMASRSMANKGEFDQAFDLTKAAESIVLARLGKENITYGNVCSVYGWMFLIQGDFPQAEVWLLRTVEIKGKYLGQGHIASAYDLTRLGILYQNIGNNPDSERFLVEAKNINEANFGKQHPEYAMAIIRLATLYAQIDEGEKAEALFLEAKSLFDAGLIDKKHHFYSICLNNLANVYTDLGLDQKAEPLYLQSLEIIKRDLGEDHPEYARGLSNLARSYIGSSRFTAAEPLLLQAKTIMEKAGKTEAAVYSEIIGNLSSLYIESGQLERAEPLVLQALAVEEKLSGRKHHRTALTLSILAELYRKKGDVKKAEASYLEALAIFKTTHGKDHPFYINTLHGLIDLYWTLHRFSEVISLTEEAWEGEKLMIVNSAHHLSERELSEQLASFRVYQNTLYSYSQRLAALSSTSFDNALFHKGFLLNSILQLQGMVTRNPTADEKLSKLKLLQRRLSEQYASPIAERDSTNVFSLEAEANSLEKELARTVAGYSEAIRQVRWQEVQAALKPGETAIEFVDYQYFDPKPTDSVMYAALLIHPGDLQPHFIPLFEKKELLPLLRGATGGNNFLKINALYASNPFADGQKSPYELIWKPLEQALKNTFTVYCSASGLLHYLNLAAIPTPDGKPIGDARHLVLLGSTRSLAVDSKESSLVIPNAANNALKADAYLAGGIRYESDSTAISMSIASSIVGTRSIETTTIAFQPDSSATRAGDLNYLPATATEVREIGQMLRAANFSTKIDTGFFASEEAFRSLGIGKPSPRILHLATHGYFFPDPKGKKTNAGQEPVFKMSEHPMIRSGLIMAGAKQAWLTGKHPEGQEDGILTAYEISQMNLSNTELVVLSACETGLGQVSGNEGVYGLQRAFKIAGVKYLIMSLWKVDDRSTQAFMAEFYKQWLQGKQPIPEAFRAAQKSMRAKSPGAYDWAGFVLIE